MDFFEKFKQAEWEFTYGAEDSPEKHNALQVGLVAYFYIDKGYLPEKRQQMAKAFALYHREFGEKLKWGFFRDPNRPKNYHSFTLEDHQSLITEGDGEHMDFYWSSEEGFRYASDYHIEAVSCAGWYEYVHGPVSYLGFYLPVKELKERGVIYFNHLIKEYCSILEPIHGLFGLGIQQCQEYERYQHFEYDIGQEFLGVDIPNGNTDKYYRDGLRSINWFTFINNGWLDKLGNTEKLQSQLNDKNFEIIKYDSGVIIRAGEYPELGWKKDNPYPELYVKANNVLRPIRAPKIDSLGYGSIAGEIRFDEASTEQWLKRFDVELPSETSEQKKSAVDEPVRITGVSGEICPHTGRWSAFIGGSLQYAQLQQEQIIPEWTDKNGKVHQVRWTLLEREDGGSVYVLKEQ
ncbi:DUF3396 domain-containing protein [Xenorhabdus sp. M]|uniref:DUF3396 domain-containing protein n=1 Tax=Xenorhabdus szentirmaii TaxID=290112 RepID=A0AAW3YWL0_9GAMM|nr:type VI immunity family protein [Xenorhabdus sp. M]MBD2801706.1 DUF3396 domain-containing protein [Xenorhabdus sp. M]